MTNETEKTNHDALWIAAIGAAVTITVEIIRAVASK